MSAVEINGVICISGGYDMWPLIEVNGIRGCFERTVSRSLTEWIKECDDHAALFWGSLANVIWISPDGDKLLYSYRAAGDLVATLLEEGNYLQWYCSSESGRVHQTVADVLAAAGWTYKHAREEKIIDY